ncbi:hypothetical protein [Arthrobacter sp. D3-16]
MALQNYPDWERLVGALVQIRRGNQVIRTGIVENVMPDSSVLWLAADGINLRQMYAAAENYAAWVEPLELHGESTYRMTSSRLYG